MSIIFNSADIAETMNNGVSNVTGADSTITENYSNVVQHGIKIDMSVSEKTISGTPPLSFNSNGTPLIDYTIYGNTIQSSECGDRTRNLFDKNASYSQKSTTNDITISGLDPNKYYTCSTNFEKISGVDTASLYFGGGSSLSNGVWSDTPRTFRPNSNGEIVVNIRYVPSTDGAPAIYDDLIAGDVWVMVNEGNTPLDYEPYGYKIPISVSRRIYNVYIGNSPLRKAIDSSNAVDTINYGTQQLIRRVDSNGTALSEPVTETIEVPLIETIDGINVIDIQTTLKPSNISITYKGR